MIIKYIQSLFLAFAAVGAIAFLMTIIGDYLTYRDLQKRLKKEKGEVDG